ncbi:ead/Ea22-like family protein [Salmonella enterica subsp. enterica serovar Corvallis]|uniref:Ead/Ea22-like family protein n=5 Tax=Salmonella enterica TaxID=28901 RepID=A0A5V8XNR3_SALTM|nr:ead/Ea22-like family protein [Salmonella enterica]EAA6458435.1 ead/Ea22-like family protein [Salmonella enterica subsp. enterica serovar Corvallis]EBH8130574.1 ead/Ea22-like family protein [Salmonella enterica subsp. enterica serovar Typhimurium str. UK-1]EBV4888463.1 ead/Ea22-like family protein [Salmonella enterica subsp. enterica serovar Hadar]EBW1641878.1 ead/Ea22-like family protein [Salmonella enterica subsp. enterica serovar Kisangani]ECD6969772.1 ead/Ea22-like family protein [Salmon
MSNIDKQALRERYSPKPVPECHICGKEMTIQRMSASRITYGCTGATYDDKGCHYAEGRSIADDHYEQSRVTVVDVSDPDVLALLDENIQLQREKDATEAVALALRDDMRDAREKLEAAERRIAELEARKVNLSKLSVGEVMYVSGFSRDYAEGWCAGNDNAIHEIRTAGIKVKGE